MVFEFDTCSFLNQSPALVRVDLLLYELSVGALCSLLSHRHQLDQLRPEQEGKQKIFACKTQIL